MNKRKLAIIFVSMCVLFVITGMTIDNIRLSSKNYDYGVGLGFLLAIITIILVYTLDILIPVKKREKNNKNYER